MKTINRRLLQAQAGILSVCIGWVALVPSDARAQEQPADWRAANDVVGKFLRGHIDVYKAERSANPPNSAKQKKDETRQGQALTLAQAKQLALAARSAQVFTEPGRSLVEKTQQDVALVQFLSDVQRSWIAAVGAQKQLRLQENATEAAVIAQELGKRMGIVGNWGQDRVLAVSLQAKAEQLKLIEAQETAQQAREALAVLVMTQSFVLPPELPAMRGLGARTDLNAAAASLAKQRLAGLPDYTASVMQVHRLREQAGHQALDQWKQYTATALEKIVQGSDSAAPVIDPSKVLWNHSVKESLHAQEALTSLETRTQSTVALAQQTVRSSHAKAMLLQNEMLPLAEQAQEEAVYQYNGMFISTWNLLDQYRARLSVEMAAVAAQVQFLDADLAFKAYLAGADYRPPVGSAISSQQSAASGGH